MKYFESFPRTLYTFNKNTINVNAITNILARSTFLREVTDNVDLSYEYLISEEDTPDILAHKIYGDSYRSWIILLFNNILNPNYDWPLKQTVLDSYIEKKYSMTLQESQTTIHHYEKEVTSTSLYQGVIISQTVETSVIGDHAVNFRTNALTPHVPPLPTIADTSNSVTSESVSFTDYELIIVTKHKAVSIYTFETEENDKKRKIRILDPKYIARVENEFKELMSNG